jgi:N-acetylglucosaminyl-diphospho-decaprenol L-rhamnosyltransferase
VTASIDVVIPAHDRYDLTAKCLRHLAAQTIAHHVIVVDNGSTDDTRARVASEWPEVQLEFSDEHRGFPETCNRGVAAGSGELVVLLNNDVDCRPEFLEHLRAPFEDPRMGTATPLLLQVDERLIDSVGLVADVTLSGFPRQQGRDSSEAAAKRPLLLGPSGGAAAYRRSAWEEVGGLDEAITFYMEDLELALRLRAAGWQAALASDAVGVHLGSATHGHRSAWQRGHSGFARGYILRRYGILRGRRAPRTLATEAVVVLGDVAISRDLAALKGRVSGWRAARGEPRLSWPPAEALDQEISFRDSLRLRRAVYARRAA